MKVGSLFAGIGGFDLAARWMGWETRWFSEIDPYASAVLQKHWPGVPNHGDITKIDFTTVEPVDLLCGGFPCQDISNAGKRAGITGERSRLWVEFARAAESVRPRWLVVENVAALLGRGYDVVRGDLRAVGYRVARPVIMSASQVGAPHLRERQWIVAHLSGDGCGQGVTRRPGSSASREQQPPLSIIANTKGDGQRAGLRESQPAGLRRGRPGNGVGPRALTHTTGVFRQAEQRHESDGAVPCDHWRGEPWRERVNAICRVDDGVSGSVDALRGLGLSIVPQCALAIFSAIQEAEERMRAA